jgi:pantothenate kinase
MKIVGEYTCRGTITPSETEPRKIVLFDGKFDTGYRVKKFVVSPYDIDNTNFRSYVGKLATSATLDPREWNWADQREVGWAVFSWDANNILPATFEQVDTDQIIVEDLYVYAEEPGGSTTSFLNYYIELEKVEITDWQGALSMARDKASGDD